MKLTALGIDGGFAIGGWTLMLVGPQEEDDCIIDMGIFETTKSNRKRKVLSSSDDHRRSKELTAFLDRKIRQNNVQIVCVESKSLPRNAATSSRLGAFFGIVASLCHRYDLPLADCTPQELKKHLCGRINVTDEELNRAIDERYSEAEYFTGKVCASKRQHPYDSLGAIDVCKTGEVFGTLRSVLRGIE